MNSIGALLTQAGVAPKQARPRVASTQGFRDTEPRLYRVQLAYEVVGEIEVTARSPYEAQCLANERKAEAKRRYRSEASAYRCAIRMRVDPRDVEKGFKWVRLEEGRDEVGNSIYLLGKDDHP